MQPVNNPVITPTRVPFNSNWAGQKLRATQSCMYRLFWYSRLSQTRSVRITKDSPNAASLALRSICSAFRRCRSRVSDINRETGSFRCYKMRGIVPSKLRYFRSLEAGKGPNLSKCGGICEGLLAPLYPATRGDTEPCADINTGIAQLPVYSVSTSTVLPLGRVQLPRFSFVDVFSSVGSIVHAFLVTVVVFGLLVFNGCRVALLRGG